MENIHQLKDLRPTSLPVESYDEFRGSKTPIIIDNGSWECRVGWATDKDPRLVFRNVLAKTRRDKSKESELLVGSDITNIEAVRHALRSPFDKDVVTHYEASEHLLDHSFSHLGIDTDQSVPHPIFLTETLAQPNLCRQLTSQLMFELYGVPALCYGVDCLLSARHNVSQAGDCLVVSLGHQTLHIVPVLAGTPVINKARRVNFGGAQMTHFLQRTLQLKYPNHVNNISLSRAEELFTDHTKVVTEFFDKLKLWKDPDYYDENVVKIQLPFNITARPANIDPEALKQRRQELAKRLVELNAKKRDERLVKDSLTLKQMLAVKEYSDQGLQSKFSKALAKLGMTDMKQLEVQIDKIKVKIDKAKEAKLKAEQGVREEKEEPEIKKRREDMDDAEKEEFDSWISDIRDKLTSLKDKKQARWQKRQQMAKRRTAASQERMRIISQLAKHTKKEDTFGMNDDDWEVYKQISMDGGDSDSEEENLQAAEYEALLKEHDPEDDEVGKDNPEWHQIHLATEVIKTPEILFQPSIIGHDQAGLGELIEFVLSKFDLETADRLANNVLLTGGLANLQGLQERVEYELRSIRPFNSTFKVVTSSDPSLDAWRGAAGFVESQENLSSFLSQEKYYECGEGYLEEHFFSNKFYPTPSPSEKLDLISAPATPLVREETSCPSTPRTFPDSSNPSSPAKL